jgi:hypothetical protein
VAGAVPLSDTLPQPLAERELRGDGDTVKVALPEGVREARALPVKDAVAHADAEGDPEGVPQPVAEGVAVDVTQGEGEPPVVGVAPPVAVVQPLPEPLALSEAVAQ